MATITPVVGAEAVTAAPFAATAPGGDNILVSSLSDDYLIEFTNGAAGAVTFTIPAVTGSQDLSGVGKVTKPSLTQAVPAGAARAILIRASLLNQYVNGSGVIPITYTSPDVLFTVRALRIPN